MASKSKSTQTTNTDMGPWKVQQPYLTETFKEAQGLYQANKGTPGYTGDFYAGLSDTQRQAIDQGTSFFQNRGMGQANMLMDTGNTLLGSGAGGIANSALGLYNLGMSDRAGSAIDSAGRYAMGMADAGVVDAAMRDIERNAAEGVVPNMYRANAASGNLNSDRAALAQGVVDRGLAEKRADIYGQLFSQGLGLAQNDQAASARDLTAAGGLYDAMTGRGMSAADQGFTTAGQTGSAILDLQGLDQADRQSQLENAFQKQQYAEMRPYDLLNRYYGLVGANNWGQQGTSTTVGTQTTTPGAASIIGGAVGALGSLFGGGGMLGGLGAFGKAGALGGFFGKP